MIKGGEFWVSSLAFLAVLFSTKRGRGGKTESESTKIFKANLYTNTQILLSHPPLMYNFWHHPHNTHKENLLIKPDGKNQAQKGETL